MGFTGKTIKCITLKVTCYKVKEIRRVKKISAFVINHTTDLPSSIFRWNVIFNTIYGQRQSIPLIAFHLHTIWIWNFLTFISVFIFEPVFPLCVFFNRYQKFKYYLGFCTQSHFACLFWNFYIWKGWNLKKSHHATLIQGNWTECYTGKWVVDFKLWHGKYKTISAQTFGWQSWNWQRIMISQNINHDFLSRIIKIFFPLYFYIIFQISKTACHNHKKIMNAIYLSLYIYI